MKSNHAWNETASILAAIDANEWKETNVFYIGMNHLLKVGIAVYRLLRCKLSLCIC